MKKTVSVTLCKDQDRMNGNTRQVLADSYGDACATLYKRIAKPRNTPPKTATVLRAAFGTKPDGAAPTLGVLEAVACCPPKPVTGILFVAEAPPVCEAVAMEEEREALPK